MYPVSAAAAVGLLPGGRPGRPEGEVDRGAGQEKGAPHLADTAIHTPGSQTCTPYSYRRFIDINKH